MIYLQLPSDRTLGATILGLFVLCLYLGYIAWLIIKGQRQQRRMLDRHPSATVRGGKPPKVVEMKLDETERRISE